MSGKASIVMLRNVSLGKRKLKREKCWIVSRSIAKGNDTAAQRRCFVKLPNELSHGEGRKTERACMFSRIKLQNISHVLKKKLFRSNQNKEVVAIYFLRDFKNTLCSGLSDDGSVVKHTRSQSQMPYSDAHARCILNFRPRFCQLVARCVEDALVHG